MNLIEPMPEPIAKAINEIMGKVTYVQKTGQNQFHNYKFTKVEDLLTKLQPAMHEAGLIVVQSEREATLNGSVMSVKYQFTLSHKSGATWAERPELTGMSVAVNSKGGFDDKCANKCFTAAGKYFLQGLFKIPTGLDADPDADEEQHLPPVQPPSSPPAAPSQQRPPAPPATTAPGDGTFLLVCPNNTIGSRHVRPSEFLQALEDAMLDGDDPVAWWERNRQLVEAIVVDYPKAKPIHDKLQQLADDFTHKEARA